jgi:hypothetical protein
MAGKIPVFPLASESVVLGSRSLLAAGEEAGLITEAVLLSSAWCLEFGICFCANMGASRRGSHATSIFGLFISL